MRVRKVVAQHHERPNHINPCRLSRYSALRAVKGVPWMRMLIASGHPQRAGPPHPCRFRSATAGSPVTGHPGAAAGTANHPARAQLRL
ncbi:hypothetical protein NDU88_004944 [Pleurodeles waltl]|uniref:Uncharacterized protein n=1 Tax=Pleurodeles waltl TaxID=8319 RepID=A0AAV7WZA8_PLEWA|nr:hypothetical protein NDU88_004944 [Pleurodeles waltl]